MKLLLYCTKAKPYLAERLPFNEKKFYQCRNKNDYYSLNGKIVAECDFEVEKIKVSYEVDAYEIIKCFTTETIKRDIDFYTKSCLYGSQIDKYLNGNKGYAIHIKNLHIFDKPKKLEEVYKIDNVGGKLFTHSLKKAPQNMMYVSVNRWIYDFYEPSDINILISIKPEWLCKILNGEKTIEVRKKVLKEMLK